MIEKLIATNPCGEQPLGAWSVCNLGAMNLVAYINNEGEFDYDSLGQDVQVAMRFMDNVCDANFYFYKETYERQMDIRRTGLGTMGLGDALIKMKIKYGSDESVSIIEKIYKIIRDNAYFASKIKVICQKRSCHADARSQFDRMAETIRYGAQMRTNTGQGSLAQRIPMPCLWRHESISYCLAPSVSMRTLSSSGFDNRRHLVSRHQNSLGQMVLGHLPHGF